MTRRFVFRAARTTLIAGLCLAAAACGSRQQANRIIDADKAEAEAAVTVLNEAKPVAGPVNVRFTNEVWLGDRGVRFSNGEPLPARLEGDDGLSLNTGPRTLVQIANLIQRTTGIPVRNAETVMLWDQEIDDNEGSADSAGGMPVPPSAGGALGDAFGASYEADSPLVRGTAEFPALSLHYTGPLSGLLNQISDHFGISWRYEDGAIKFVGLETRTYTLWALNVVQNTTSSVQGQIIGETGTGTGASGGATGSSKAGTEAQISSNYWESVLDTIRGIVPQSGQFITTNPSAGTITVTARPSVQERVAEYVRSENDRLARQVAIAVKVYSFQSSRSDDYSVDLQAAFNGSSNLGFGIANAAQQQTFDASQFQIGVLSGGFAGSEIFVNALSKRGRVSLVTSASVTTLNNQTAPISILNQQGYLARVSVTTDGNAGTTTASLEPGVVSSGFTMNVTPRIMSNHEMILNYSATLSDLASLTEFSSNGSSIQIPEVNSRAIMESVRIRSGNTLVLAGFEQTDNLSDNAGVGLPEIPVFGGGVSASTGRKLIVILMTPVVLEDQNQLSAPVH